MSEIRRLPNGRWQLDLQDKQLGIPRTKRTRDTKKECEELEAIIRAHHKNLLRGGRARRLFGEALAEYLKGPSTEKRTHNDDLSNAQALRWPVRDDDSRRWVRLEELPLEKLNDTELDIIDGMDIWLKDMRGILDRRYFGHRLYQLRRNGRGLPTWYRQPYPDEGPRPQPRVEVKDRRLLDRLEHGRGRGPMRPDTIRIRQALVSRVLKWAYRKRWTDSDQSGRIERQPPGEGRKALLGGYEPMRDLLIHLQPHYALAVLAGVTLGWRRSNLLDLTWSGVEMPVWRETNDPERPELVQPGIAMVDRQKNGQPLVHPMSLFTEQIFRLAWDWRQGEHVFHNGSGKRIGDIRKAYNTAQKRAGIEPRLTWHGLRHTWSTWMAAAGVNKHALKELGGWKQDRMPSHYTHLQVDHLLPHINQFSFNRKED